MARAKAKKAAAQANNNEEKTPGSTQNPAVAAAVARAKAKKASREAAKKETISEQSEPNIQPIINKDNKQIDLNKQQNNTQLPDENKTNRIAAAVAKAKAKKLASKD